MKSSDNTSSTTSIDTSNDSRYFWICKGILDDLKALESMLVDSSILKKCPVVVHIKNILKGKYSKVLNNHLPEIITMASTIKEKWLKKMTLDHHEQTIAAMKGGNQIGIAPNRTDKEQYESAVITCPENISIGLWKRLVATYNHSHLFAIKYVSTAATDTICDTKVSLIQAPPQGLGM